MLTLTDDEKEALARLGVHLKQRRLELNDRQCDSAARLGVSLGTYRKMEAGNPSIPISYWLRMIRLYGDLKLLDTVLVRKKSLFDRIESEKQTARGSTRKRAQQR